MGDNGEGGGGRGDKIKRGGEGLPGGICIKRKRGNKEGGGAEEERLARSRRKRKWRGLET